MTENKDKRCFMVRGVNRQIIEINDTGNKYFEKALLFVTPGRGDTSDAKLNYEAKEYLASLSGEIKPTQTLRSHHRKKRLRRGLIIGGCVLSFCTGALLLILNIL